jgi:hypothetical protein
VLTSTVRLVVLPIRPLTFLRAVLRVVASHTRQQAHSRPKFRFSTDSASATVVRESIGFVDLAEIKKFLTKGSWEARRQRCPNKVFRHRTPMWHAREERFRQLAASTGAQERLAVLQRQGNARFRQIFTVRTMLPCPASFDHHRQHLSPQFQFDGIHLDTAWGGTRR